MRNASKIKKKEEKNYKTNKKTFIFFFVIK
jgi:hypothetical protein